MVLSGVEMERKKIKIKHYSFSSTYALHFPYFSRYPGTSFVCERKEFKTGRQPYVLKYCRN
jgi:hypothetical protein